MTNLDRLKPLQVVGICLDNLDMALICALQYVLLIAINTYVVIFVEGISPLTSNYFL